jgi:hypothetical protein
VSRVEALEASHSKLEEQFEAKNEQFRLLQLELIVRSPRSLTNPSSQVRKRLSTATTTARVSPTKTSRPSPVPSYLLELGVS